MAGFPAPNILDPTQQKGREKRAYADFRRRLRAINAEIQERVVDQLQPREIAVNGLRAYLLNAEKVYIYELDYLQLRRIDETIAEIIQRIMMQRGEQWDVWMQQYTAEAYQHGAAYAQSSLAVQSAVYASAYSNIESVLFTPEYQRRIAVVTSRTFNSMEGFTDDLITTTRRILGDTIAQGKSPRYAAQQLKGYLVDTEGTQAKAASRAATIARTELGVAYRSAVMDESQRASESLGLVTKLLWVSALMATTRKTHGEKHSDILTRAQVAEFYSKNGNSINCRCSQSIVVVDEKGDAYAKRILDKMKKQEAAWVARGGG
ncbi:Phage Mu protein F like protein [compost metagenome]